MAPTDQPTYQPCSAPLKGCNIPAIPSTRLSSSLTDPPSPPRPLTTPPIFPNLGQKTHAEKRDEGDALDAPVGYLETVGGPRQVNLPAAGAHHLRLVGQGVHDVLPCPPRSRAPMCGKRGLMR